MEKSDQQPTAAAPLDLPVDKTGHKVTAGERKFDRINYTAIGYVANALLSVVAVAAVERTQGGQRMMANFRDWAKRNVKFLTPEKAEMLATKTFFLSGGFAVMVPMKWMEDAKTHLVKKWNREIYGARAETDPTIQQSQRELEQGPRQGWLSILGSRVLALVPFYVAYGALWDRKSAISKATNPELRAMSKEAITAMEKDAPEEFSKLASKGFYIDKPIAAVSRWVGKAAAKLTGNGEVVTRLEGLEAAHPGTIRSATNVLAHDPVHSATPYYFISEAITSAIVAWGVYVLSRTLGPMFDRKRDHSTPHPKRDHSTQPVPWQPSNSAIPIAEETRRATVNRDGVEPDTNIMTQGALHEAAATVDIAQAR